MDRQHWPGSHSGDAPHRPVIASPDDLSSPCFLLLELFFRRIREIKRRFGDGQLLWQRAVLLYFSSASNAGPAIFGVSSTLAFASLPSSLYKYPARRQLSR